MPAYALLNLISVPCHHSVADCGVVELTLLGWFLLDDNCSRKLKVRFVHVH